MEIALAGVRFVLRAERAVYLPDEQTLLVADAHFGKAVAFRRQGVPVPAGTTREMLGRLDRLLTATGARHIVFLGDLLHARSSTAPGTVGEVTAWRDANPSLELTLVRGNHDQHAGDPPAAWAVRVLEGPLVLGPLRLQHHPEPDEAGYVVAGHVHPCAWVGGRGPDRLRLPCFHLGERVAVLPAFGAFTGMHALPRGPADRVVVIAGDALRDLPRERERAPAPYTATPR
jgi:uncharacterized protein